MTPSSALFIALVLGGMIPCGPAHAFSNGPAASDSADGPERESPDDRNTADYRYSGSNFSVSMSRNPTPPNEGAAVQEGLDDHPAPRSQPGFLSRLWRETLGRE